MEYLGTWGTLIHEKNLKSKISCQTPFKMNIWIRVRASDEDPEYKLLMRIRTHTLQMRIRIYTLDEDPDLHSR
jgi:hypothetical protein